MCNVNSGSHDFSIEAPSLYTGINHFQCLPYFQDPTTVVSMHFAVLCILQTAGFATILPVVCDGEHYG